MFIGHQDSNMAKVIHATMSEWHQVQRKYALEIDVQYIFDLHEGDKTLEECQVIFDKIAEGDMLVEDLEEVGNFGMDWDYQDEDDWWTMRKGGFDVTYSQEVVEQEPISANPEFMKTISEAKQAVKDWKAMAKDINKNE